MVDWGDVGERVNLYVTFPIYLFVILPVYRYVLSPIFKVVSSVVGWISWSYGFRGTIMVQGLVCYWRACLYFERSSLWEKFVEKHRKHHDEKSYFIPLFWTMNGLFLFFIILLVLAAVILGENTMRRVFNIQGKIGLNFYCLGKSVGELSILRLMVFIGDHVADKSVAEMDIASCFVCGYLSVASLFKLCHVGNDLGFLDGIASVVLSIITHYCKSHRPRIFAIFIGGFVILLKNILFTECCPPCSQEEERRGGCGGGGVGGGGGGGRGRGERGGGHGGGRGGDVRILVDDQDEVYHSARSSTSARRSAEF